MYVHCMGCLWYYITSGDETWVPMQDNQIVEDYTTPIWDYSLMDKYLFFSYQSLCILTANDWFPNTSFTCAFASLAIIIGIIVTANLFGELAAILYELNRNEIKYQSSVDSANTSL